MSIGKVKAQRWRFKPSVSQCHLSRSSMPGHSKKERTGPFISTSKAIQFRFEVLVFGQAMTKKIETQQTSLLPARTKQTDKKSKLPTFILAKEATGHKDSNLLSSSAPLLSPDQSRSESMTSSFQEKESARLANLFFTIESK